MYTFINYIETQKIKIEKAATSISLKKIDDVTSFNREQRRIFDRDRIFHSESEQQHYTPSI